MTLLTKSAARSSAAPLANCQQTKNINSIPDFSFKSWGISANSHSIREYERGKRLLESIDLTPEQYHLLIKSLADYIGV